MLKLKAKIFQALSDSNRLRILKALQTKSLCACEIKEILGLANSTVSQHLSILKESGFIVEQKEGKWINFSINSKPEDPIISSILAMMHLWLNDVDEIKKDHQTVLAIDKQLLCYSSKEDNSVSIKYELKKKAR